MKDKLSQNGQRIGIAAFLLAAAFFPLFVASKCSPLYPFNDWPDLNIFFTIGKGMVNGKVIYADLMDHKGPYVYAAAALAYLCSHDTFFGVFLQELVNLFVFLLFAWKTVGLYVEEKEKYIWLLPLLSAGVVSSKSFVHGGSMEEFCIGIYAYGIYTLLCFLKEDKPAVNRRSLVVNGLLAGALFWAKFTVLGFYIAWIMVIAAVNIAHKSYRAFLQNTAIFLAAFLTPTLPWLFYFGCHRRIGVWLQVYLWNNIFGYSASGGDGLLVRLGKALLTGFRAVKDPENLCYGMLLMVGCIVFVCLPGRVVRFREKAAIAVLGLASVLGIFICGTLQDYYSMPLAAFSVFGILAAALGLERLAAAPEHTRKQQGKTAERDRQPRTSLVVVLSVVMLAAMTVLSYRLSSNAYLLAYTKEEMPQYRFARMIEESDDTSVLNYGFLDGGFYTVLDQVPQVRYFCTMNINPDVCIMEQNSYVEQELTNWLVTWKGYTAQREELENLPVVSEHYELVDYVYFPLELEYRTYALYKRIDRPGGAR